MANGGDSQKGLVAVILILVVALVVVVVLWQRDRESKDLRLDIDTGDAGTIVEPGPAVAAILPEGVDVPGA